MDFPLSVIFTTDDFDLLLFTSKKGSPSNEEAAPLTAPQTEGVQPQLSQQPSQQSSQQQQQEVATTEIPGMLYKVKTQSFKNTPFCLNVLSRKQLKKPLLSLSSFLVKRSRYEDLVY